MVQFGMRVTISTYALHTFTDPHAKNVPEYAKAGMCAVGEATETKPLASLKVSQNKSKVLHGHSIPRSVQMNVVRGGDIKEQIGWKCKL